MKIIDIQQIVAELLQARGCSIDEYKMDEEDTQTIDDIANNLPGLYAKGMVDYAEKDNTQYWFITDLGKSYLTHK